VVKSYPLSESLVPEKMEYSFSGRIFDLNYRLSLEYNSGNNYPGGIRIGLRLTKENQMKKIYSRGSRLNLLKYFGNSIL